MAFSFENQSDNKNILNIVGIVAIVLFLGIGTYLLFFTKEPLVDIAAPSELESVSQLSDANIEEGILENDPTYQKLERKADDIEPGEAGRENPFARF
jgi:hypothetical protein